MVHVTFAASETRSRHVLQARRWQMRGSLLRTARNISLLGDAAWLPWHYTNLRAISLTGTPRLEYLSGLTCVDLGIQCGSHLGPGALGTSTEGLQRLLGVQRLHICRFTVSSLPPNVEVLELDECSVADPATLAGLVSCRAAPCLRALTLSRITMITFPHSALHVGCGPL